MTYLFGWLSIRDVIIILFFCIAAALLITNERFKNSDTWFIGILLWTAGIIFDAVRRIEGMSDLRILEHLFQLTGSIVIAFAAYKTYKKLIKEEE